MVEEPQPPAHQEPPPADTAPVMRTEELFGPLREICIEHAGETYRLRITRRGKLILQK